MALTVEWIPGHERFWGSEGYAAQIGLCWAHTYRSAEHRWVVYRDGECMASGRAADEADARGKAVTVAAMYGGEL